MASFKTCPRRHYYEYEEGIRPDRESDPLRIGSVMHEALDQRAQGIDHQETVAWIRANYANVPGWVQDLDAWEVERETCIALFRGYCWRWQNEQIQYRQSEFAFSLPIINPQTGKPSRNFRKGGKIDKDVYADGRGGIGEHKTTSDDIAPDSDYWQRLRLDQQVSHYYLAAREIGVDVQTVLYDVIRKPNIEPLTIPILDGEGMKIVHDADGNRVFLKNGKPRQAGNKKEGWTLLSKKQSPAEFGERVLKDCYNRPDWYFARREIPRLESDIHEYEYELWQIQKVIALCQKNHWWYKNTNACLKPYKCPYLSCCTNGQYPLTEVPQGFVRLENIHPELGDTNGNCTATA